MVAIILKYHHPHHYPPYHHREDVAIKLLLLLLLLLLMNYLDLREWRARQLETAKEKKTRQEQIQQLRRAQVFGLVTWLSSVVATPLKAASQVEQKRQVEAEAETESRVLIKIISILKYF